MRKKLAKLWFACVRWTDANNQQITAALAAFILMAASSTATYILMRPPTSPTTAQTELSPTPAQTPPAPSPKAPEPISEARQEQVSYHEAGHALLIRTALGEEFLGELVVRTEEELELKPEKRTHGSVGWGVDPPESNFPQAMRKAAAFMGGKAADKFLNDRNYAGDHRDRENATDDLTKIQLAQGHPEELIVRKCPSETDYRAVNARLVKAELCAETAIMANIETVVALAELVMSRPPEKGGRRVSAEELVQFFKDHPLIDGMVTNKKGVLYDPCDFGSRP